MGWKGLGLKIGFRFSIREVILIRDLVCFGGKVDESMWVICLIEIWRLIVDLVIIDDILRIYIVKRSRDMVWELKG